MATTTTAPLDSPEHGDGLPDGCSDASRSVTSDVSWGAVAAGAAAGDDVAAFIAAVGKHRHPVRDGPTSYLMAVHTRRHAAGEA
jgi:hypothetical protein